MKPPLRLPSTLCSRCFVMVFCCYLLLAYAPIAFADAESIIEVEESTSQKQQPLKSKLPNPPPRGRAKKIVGIVLMPVSSVAALSGILLTSGYPDRPFESEAAFLQAKKEKRRSHEKIGAIGLLGVASGFGLLMQGVYEGREWRKWHNENRLINSSTSMIPTLDLRVDFSQRALKGEAEWRF